jgi:hypothetical protein
MFPFANSLDYLSVPEIHFQAGFFLSLARSGSAAQKAGQDFPNRHKIAPAYCVSWILLLCPPFFISLFLSWYLSFGLTINCFTKHGIVPLYSLYITTVLE